MVVLGRGIFQQDLDTKIMFIIYICCLFVETSYSYP